MSVVSANRHLIDGDIGTGRGQLGLCYSGSGVTGPLWNIYRAGNRYNISPVSAVTISLPVVGTAVTEAQPGHWVTISNTATNSANTITITNSDALTLNTLPIGKSAMYVADLNVAAKWVIQYDTGNYGNATTLQQAYNASGSANPQIALNTFGALKINDSATPVDALLQLKNNAGTYTYMDVGNATTGSQTPMVSFLNANNAAGNSGVFASGSVTVSASNSGVTAFADSNSTTVSDGINTFQTSFVGGSVAYGGTTRAATGTAKTSPNERMLWVTANGVTTAGTTISFSGGSYPNTFIFPNGSYHVEATLLGRDIASSVSVSHKLSAMLTFVASTGSVLGNTIDTRETPGYTSIFSSASFGISGTTLQLTLNAPDNISGGTVSGQMDFRGYVKIITLIE